MVVCFKMGNTLKFITNIPSTKMKTFFIVKMVKYWNKLSSEVIVASSLKIFKIRLIGVHFMGEIWKFLEAGRLKYKIFCSVLILCLRSRLLAIDKEWIHWQGVDTGLNRPMVWLCMVTFVFLAFTFILFMPFAFHYFPFQ